VSTTRRSGAGSPCLRARVCGLVILVGTFTAHARPTLPNDETVARPCRPTIACTADLVAPGMFELEAGYLYRLLAGGVNQHSVPFLLKLTAFEWLQVQVGSNGAIFNSGPVAAQYVDDAVVTAKLHFIDQGEYAPSVSVSAGLSIPVSSAPGFLRTTDALMTAFVTKDVGPLHADLNAGFNLWRLEQPILPQGWVALALSVALPKGFGVMAEGYSFSNAAPVAPMDAGVLMAISFSPKPWLVIDAGADVGLVRQTRVVSAFTGLTIVPVRFWGGT
jgi:hypothetical protein